MYGGEGGGGSGGLLLQLILRDKIHSLRHCFTIPQEENHSQFTATWNQEVRKETFHALLCLSFHIKDSKKDKFLHIRHNLISILIESCASVRGRSDLLTKELQNRTIKINKQT